MSFPILLMLSTSKCLPKEGTGPVKLTNGHWGREVITSPGPIGRRLDSFPRQPGLPLPPKGAKPFLKAK